MMKFSALLAQLDLNPLGPMPPVTKTTGGMARDLMLIGGVVLALSVLLLFWARRYARRSKRHHRHQQVIGAHPVATEGHETRRHHRHRHRHRRRHHSPAQSGKNPTLAETGGLPPLRPESGSNPPA